jgi:hypothetical protein
MKQRVELLPVLRLWRRRHPVVRRRLVCSVAAGRWRGLFFFFFDARVYAEFLLFFSSFAEGFGFCLRCYLVGNDAMMPPFYFL